MKLLVMTGCPVVLGEIVPPFVVIKGATEVSTIELKLLEVTHRHHLGKCWIRRMSCLMQAGEVCIGVPFHNHLDWQLLQCCRGGALAGGLGNPIRPLP